MCCRKVCLQRRRQIRLVRPGHHHSAVKTIPHTGLAAILTGQGDLFITLIWFGDANLDGVVNADDYFQTDSGFISQRGGWYNGDFNYDGVVNADDYFLIDSAFIGQSGPLAASKPEMAVSAADVAVQQKARKTEPDGILSQLFSTEAVLHLSKDGKEGSRLDKDSSYWMDIQAFDADGKPAKGLPGDGGWFEMSIPSPLLSGQTRTLTLAWVDFYRD